METVLILSAIFLLLVPSLIVFGKKADISGFYLGLMDNNKEPSLLALTFSLVTSWIFSRSLLTAAILAYYYSFPGAIAYSLYYFSFLTGAYFVIKIRKKYSSQSVVSYFKNQFGSTGKFLYSSLIALRLLSEIFANLIVVGLIFGEDGSFNYKFSIILVMLVAFSYSYFGGFRNSIKTDVVQMIVFLILFLILIISIISTPFSLDLNLHHKKIVDFSNPAYPLIIVAILQLFSYPIHDPVMMDRGFICTIKKTRKSFIYAFCLSFFCILIFSMLGIILSSQSIENISFIQAIKDYFGLPISYLIFMLLIISAISTIDSTLSSCSKLVISDLKLLETNIFNGRLVMIIFSFFGLFFIMLNTKDLFTAVAVSGTAATFITPIFILNVIMNIRLSTSNLILSFITSIVGAIIYYIESQNLNNNFSLFFGLDHKYKTLLLLNLLIISLTFIYSLILKKK